MFGVSLASGSAASSLNPHTLSRAQLGLKRLLTSHPLTMKSHHVAVMRWRPRFKELEENFAHQLVRVHLALRTYLPAPRPNPNAFCRTALRVKNIAPSRACRTARARQVPSALASGGCLESASTQRRGYQLSRFRCRCQLARRPSTSENFGTFSRQLYFDFDQRPGSTLGFLAGVNQRMSVH